MFKDRALFYRAKRKPLFRNMLYVLSAIAPAAIVATSTPAYSFEGREKVSSGKTQVLARIGKREITSNELRVEMARLGMTQPDLQAEQFALQSIINRHLLVQAAMKSNVHRKPDAALRVKAAQDQTLADYYLATASQPPEPTLSEIEDYITANAGLFADRKLYDFSVVTMPTVDFSEEEMAPLFSETKDFAALIAVLKEKQLSFNLKPLSQASSSFPTQIRKQLLQYDVGDNIIIKSDSDTQIMKIVSLKAAPLKSEKWPAIARRIVMEENAVTKAKSLVDNLKLGNRVTYYRTDLVPVITENPDTPSPHGANSSSSGK